MTLKRHNTCTARLASFGLTSLLSGAGLTAVADFDPSRTYVVHGPLQRLPEIARLPALQSADSLIQVWRNLKVNAWPSAKMRAQRSLLLSPDQLDAAFQDGFTLYFTSVETNVPELFPVIRQLERDLSMAQGTITCEAFASSAGSGARMHFDPNMTFNVQVSGVKTWRIAANDSAPKPHIGYSVGESPGRDLLRYALGPFPAIMPESSTTFEARPGTVVYIPHGQWHATEASATSFAILFTVCQKNWLSMICELLTDQLRVREPWREIPIGLRSPDFWVVHRAKVSALLEDLSSAARCMTVEEVMRALGGPRVTTYRRSSEIEIRVEKPKNGKTWLLYLSHNGSSASRAIPKRVAAVCNWIAGRRRPFTGGAAVRALPSIDPDFVLTTLAEMESRGVLEASIGSD